MKSSNQHILETLIINKDYRDASISPKSFYELRKIIVDRYFKLGPGTKKDPIDFNDVDVSNLDSFCGEYDKGLFEGINFKYIDISYWDVSNVKSMYCMFAECDELESAGDLSDWDVSKVTNMSSMFYSCKKFNQYISDWDVSKVTSMSNMFCGCNSFNQDISDWDVSSVTNMEYIFYNCKSFNQDLSGWNVSNVRHNNDHIFHNCPIKERFKPKFK